MAYAGGYVFSQMTLAVIKDLGYTLSDKAKADLDWYGNKWVPIYPIQTAPAPVNRRVLQTQEEIDYAAAKLLPDVKDFTFDLTETPAATYDCLAPEN